VRRPDRAFASFLAVSLAAALLLSLPVLLTLFPAWFQRAVLGYDAIVQVCAAALYGVGRALPPLGLAALAIPFALFGAALIRTLALLARTRAVMARSREVALPPEVRRVAERVGVAHVTRAFDSARPVAFTAGLLRPTTWISTGALARLAPEELEAVLWHERAHVRRHGLPVVGVAR
jgi:Zn-dependent protease with chaperone function